MKLKTANLSVKGNAFFGFFAIILLLFGACSKDAETIDDEPPVIDISAADAFPVQCSTVKRGETFTFKAKLSDNVRLGAVSVDIHHNFDHHTHSTEVNDCGLEPVKVPVNPFLFIKSYAIAGAQTIYETDIQIDVPADVDPGDYHFMIMVTDEEGWSAMRGLSIKIV
ncbi:DUF4625 domain-containing protein [Sphingobacterium olei]|uniref:DUF4625 domain-containing protein n=1 Tax=Sphingobacterium olei TaxID=2571155 RepID=A0A4U0NI00_9SPHI|nr:DUF4625 domain-containing protein [Sphingobacterium olei]